MTNVVGPASSGVGSGRVRWIVIGSCGQSSPVSSGSSHGPSAWGFPWLNQSCTSNWIQAAASTFSVVAGWNVSRVSSRRLTRRGFGSSIASGGSG